MINCWSITQLSELLRQFRERPGRRQVQTLPVILAKCREHRTSMELSVIMRDFSAPPRWRFLLCTLLLSVVHLSACAKPLIDEVPKWAADFERVEVDANHWAILSQPQEIAQYIQEFALKNSES